MALARGAMKCLKKFMSRPVSHAICLYITESFKPEIILKNMFGSIIHSDTKNKFGKQLNFTKYLKKNCDGVLFSQANSNY